MSISDYHNFPLVAGGFLPAVANPSVVGVNARGLASPIQHPSAGLWIVNLANPVGLGQYTVDACAISGADKVTVQCLDVTPTQKQIIVKLDGVATDNIACSFGFRAILEQ